MLTIVLLIVAYLIGSISVGVLAHKYFKTPDPREQGSGSAGATNVFRTTGSKQQTALVLAGDGLKGLIAVLLARLLGESGMGLGFVALACVVGHIFPLYFKFKGGKGVATYMGGLLGLSIWVGLISIIAWVVIALVSRLSSLASICAIVISLLFMIVFSKMIFFFPALLTVILILWTHRDNIKRLKSGGEDKINIQE